MNVIRLKTLSATRALANRAARALTGQHLLLLSGDLGAGKTTFVRYLAKALGIAPTWVSSPSFALVQRYPAGSRGLGIAHVDLYRVTAPGDLESLGLEELLASDDLVIVEWPDAAETLWRDSGRTVVQIRFRRGAEGTRVGEVSGLEGVGDARTLGNEEWGSK